MPVSVHLFTGAPVPLRHPRRAVSRALSRLVAVFASSACETSSRGDVAGRDDVVVPNDVTRSMVAPPVGAAYTDRARVRPGMIVDPGPVTAAFGAHGWGWCGRWTTLKDYQHVSQNGR